MFHAPRKITWWIAVIIGFLSIILLAMKLATSSSLLAIVGLLLLIIATKIDRL